MTLFGLQPILDFLDFTLQLRNCLPRRAREKGMRIFRCDFSSNFLRSTMRVDCRISISTARLLFTEIRLPMIAFASSFSQHKSILFFKIWTASNFVLMSKVPWRPDAIGVRLPGWAIEKLPWLKGIQHHDLHLTIIYLLCESKSLRVPGLSIFFPLRNLGL